MTLKEITNQWMGKTVPYPDPDPDKLQGQCVQFIRYLLNVYYKTPQWFKQTGAADFWNSYNYDTAMQLHFDRILNTPEFVPQEGDICIWNKKRGNGYGHIAVVYGDKQNIGTMICLEQNWKALVVTIENHDYKDVLGFLRPKERV